MEEKNFGTQRHNVQAFDKGINERFDIHQGDPNRLYKLENARIHARGSTFSVSRIEGFMTVDVFDDETADVVGIFDMIFGPLDSLFVYYKLSGGTCKIRRFDVSDVQTPTLIDEWEVGSNFVTGHLVRKNDTIFISPVNKMINEIDGTFHLNDTVSLQPKILTHT